MHLKCLPALGHLAVLGWLLCLSANGSAQRALLIFEPATAQVLNAHNANALSTPASLTKLMTVHLAMDALAAGTLTAQERFAVSAVAAAQPPKVTGLNEGEFVTIEQLLQAVVITSGNDAAVALAEVVAGSEAEFVERMNQKALEIGMRRTSFRNASGLPAQGQRTTARDMAMLLVSLARHHRERFALFSTRAFELNGRALSSHNRFLQQFNGATGMKTGFTCRAGYNLAASAQRDGRSIMGVLLGATTSADRYAVMNRQFIDAFAGRGTSGTDLASLENASGQGERLALNRTFIAETCLYPRRAKNLHTPSDWSLEFGLEVEREAAAASAHALIDEFAQTLRHGRPLLIPRWARDIVYRVAVTGLTHESALKACERLRSESRHCVLMPEQTARLTVEQALRTLEWRASTTATTEESSDDG